ncbi:tetratricopeptide repeat protein [Azospirillum sp. B21]|uniref:tetratricopeptide repeat protein n=1 Tax=Azospirillum sp. B21 TaxID=2607496 RepID=UPI0011EE48C2|nr:tetratricopeptide repeat protein [Azospirillum sp. B21]KAA0574393.1 tetratricopeptide repeat protein [Azospirillum sp. B21]
MTVSTDALLAEVGRILPALLDLIGEKADSAGPEQAYHLTKRAKSRLGTEKLGHALALDPRSELGMFEGVLKDLANRVGRPTPTLAEQRNLQIAALRMLDFCALIAQRLGRDDLGPKYQPGVDEDLGRRQLRALELLVRSLVDEASGGQEHLRRRLESAFGPDKVQTWLKTADPNDLLSGTTFSELVSIFVDKQTFKTHHGPLFEDTAFLRFLRDQRETIRSFLDDVRRLRNIVAHNRRITPIQLALLDLYYGELAKPVGDAHQKRKTAVDPDAYLEVSNAQLDAWFGALQEDVGAIRDDLRGIADTTRTIDRRTVVIAAGVKALLAAAVISSLLAGWEVVLYIAHRWESRTLANRYADVADEIYHHQNNPEVALALIERAIALDGDNPRFQTSKAYMDGMSAVRELLNLDRPLFKEELDRAHHALASALWLERLDERQPAPNILRGQIYMALEQDDLAQAAFERAIALAPTNSFALMRLAVLKQRVGDASGALELLDRALAVDHRDKWAWLWKGVVHAENLQQWDKARGFYAEALKIDPRFDLAHYNIGWTWVNQKPVDYAMARAAFEQVLKINPNYKEAYHALGFTFGLQNQYEIAKRHYDRALKIDPNFVTAWKGRGLINQELGLMDEALADYGRALELSPRDVDLHVRRARAYLLVEKDTQAIADLTFASQLRPDHARTWTTLGDIYRRTGQHTVAIESYSRALAINPKDEVALAGRGDSRWATGDKAGAREDYDLALAAVSYRPERIWLRRGRLNEWGGNREDALRDFREARRVAPKDFEICQAEASLLVDLRRAKEAAVAIAACRQMRPKDAAVTDLQRRLQALSDTDANP